MLQILGVKRSFLLLLLCMASFSLPQVFKRDFKPPSTTLPIHRHPEWDMPLTFEVREILKQPFTYLARGNQVTVFESEDKKYVLKLFRYSRPRFLWINQLKSLFAHLNGKRGKDDLFTKMDKTMKGAYLACTLGRPFTQALYCHLNPTHNLLPTLCLKKERTYHLPLDAHRFVLQKKALPFKEALLQAKNDPEKMARSIESFILLLKNRTELGIHNSDPNLAPNFGFLDGEAVEIDFGNYRIYPIDPERQRIEINAYMTRFQHWLEANAPEYLSFLKSAS